MRSNIGVGPGGVRAVLERYRAAVSELVELRLDALEVPDLFAVLDTTQAERCRVPMAEHQAINRIVEQATPEQIGNSLKKVLADRLRITRSEAGRRIADAEMLGPRSAMTGEPLAPLWTASAAAQRAGEINTDHVREIRRFFTQLPCWVDEATRERAERELAQQAAKVRPDELRVLADKLADCLNPDGNFSDEDRAHRRGVTIGRQGSDGMSPITGWLTPEARAGLDAVLSKWAAPAMCDPADESPTVDGTPSEEAVNADLRSQAQRNHDALAAMCRSVLSSGELGSHHGLPVSIVVSTTLQELESAAGIGGTGGGTWLSMADVIRMASHAHHYLRIYDKHTSRELYLGKTKRIATPAQRIVLHAKDRGCTRPGCTVPGYQCQVHHVDEWAAHRRTDIDTLTFACESDHRLLDEEGWITRKNADGVTEWIPPPQFEFGRPRTNGYWHPERYFRMDNEYDEH
ncbi:MAG: HNH endonuclease [Mycobacteriaceae bacterium]|nr:HNH endonuclease [Mycobacteriaceae bacterium]